MRKTINIVLPIIAIALLAAMAALWPLGALAGPPAQTSDRARIQGLAFAAFPRSGDYTAGENIRVTVKFDRNVTVSGQPQLDINVGGQKRWATYYHGSGSHNLKFAYKVQASDWDSNGVSVPAGSIALRGGSITSGNNVAASLTHSGIADDASRKVKGSADTNPSFGSTAIVAQTYQKGVEITALTLPAATGGNGLLTYRLVPPPGLVFNAATRTLSGAPNATRNTSSYIYIVKDVDGDIASLSFIITVDGAPSFPGGLDTLPAQTYSRGMDIGTRTLPPATDGNTPLTYSLSPAPPDGMVFNAATRTLSGTPTTTQNAVSYTYTVTDADEDTDTLSFSITVDGAPSFPADVVGAQTYAKGEAITNLRLPSATDGNTPLSYSLSPTPPDGLVFNATTRTLSGTPTTTQNAVSYTYTVTDADEDTDTQSFSITVDGAPSFPADGVGAQTYAKGVAITNLTLPAATDGNTPLSYSLSPTPPDGLVFNATTRVLSGAPTTGQAATAYTYTVTDDDDDTDTLSFTIAVTGDYDLDDDGLIEVDSLAQLNAVRWDLNGDGAVDTGTSAADTAKYNAAFAGAIAGMGCRRDHDGNTATHKVAGCIGYELTRDLYNGGKGWKPIGGSFTATFDGNGKTIANLFIKSRGLGGLFNGVGTGGRVERLGVLGVVLNVNGDSGYVQVGGLAASNAGTISDSYATGVLLRTGTGRSNLVAVGGLVGENSGTINASYATGSVASLGNVYGMDNVGGLVGNNSGAISASYATGSVIGNQSVGGLVGQNENTGTISASYATAATGGQFSSGLVGSNADAISTSYAIGPGLAVDNTGTISASYWDTGTADVSTSTGKATRDLQSPTDYTGIYANWNTNLDGVAGNDDPWDFGTNRQYPALKYGGLDLAKQRQTSIRSDNWNAPVVGEPVVTSLNVTGATGITWQWESSATLSPRSWGNVSNATGATYVPVTADVGKRLRAKVSFTASGSPQTLTTVITAKVVATTPATAVTGAVAFVPDVTVGTKLEYAVSGTGTTDHSWRWQRCTNKEMTSGCAYIGDGAAAYRIAAADVGKYLRAYVYYADGSAWKRTTTPVLGPVVAAPAASP